MLLAISEAQMGYKQGGIPIGSVLLLPHEPDAEGTFTLLGSGITSAEVVANFARRYISFGECRKALPRSIQEINDGKIHIFLLRSSRNDHLLLLIK